jgi:hypothetical protein
MSISASLSPGCMAASHQSLQGDKLHHSGYIQEEKIGYQSELKI